MFGRPSPVKCQSQVTMRHGWPCSGCDTVVKRENELVSKEIDEFSSKPSQIEKLCSDSFNACLLFWRRLKQYIQITKGAVNQMTLTKLEPLVGSQAMFWEFVFVRLTNCLFSHQHENCSIKAMIHHRYEESCLVSGRLFRLSLSCE